MWESGCSGTNATGTRRRFSLSSSTPDALYSQHLKTMSSLFNGYKHVESFGPDEDYEEEVEECYLTLDLIDVDPALISNSETYRLIVSAQ